MAGDIKSKYAASVTPTLTNLQSLAASQTWIAGWGMAAINNTSSLYQDIIVAGSFTSASSNRQAGFINVYAVAALNDTPTWPAVSSGTLGSEGALAFSDTFRRDGPCVLIASIQADSTNGAIYTLKPTGLAQFFGGAFPPYLTLFIAHNITTTTAAGFASSGNSVYYTPVYGSYT